MKIKLACVVGVVFAFGCHMNIPPGITAQSTAEKYLDTLYRPDSVVEKIGVGYINLKDYLIPTKQKIFQQDTDLYHTPNIDWASFTKRTNNILSNGRGRNKGCIIVLHYRVHQNEHTTAFLIDSSLTKVFATISIK